MALTFLDRNKSRSRREAEAVQERTRLAEEEVRKKAMENNPNAIVNEQSGQTLMSREDVFAEKFDVEEKKKQNRRTTLFGNSGSLFGN